MKTNRLCIGTGWYADSKGHSNLARSKRITEPDWLKFWEKYLHRWIVPAAITCYVSNCEIFPNLTPRFEIITGFDEAEKLDHRHDFHVSVLFGANYALWNGMDFLYVEQDCLVHRPDLALKFAEDKNIVYGFGPNASFNTGWAEQCLMYVSNDFLPEFLNRLNRLRFHEDNLGVPERKWHDIFRDAAAFWPNGFGRKRPADFWEREKPEWFYLQQLTDADVDGFFRL